MCGIAGLLKLNAPVTHEDVAAVRRMTDAQTHCGPEGEGFVRMAMVPALEACRRAADLLAASLEEVRA